MLRTQASLEMSKTKAAGGMHNAKKKDTKTD